MSNPVLLLFNISTHHSLYDSFMCQPAHSCSIADVYIRKAHIHRETQIKQRETSDHVKTLEEALG